VHLAALHVLTENGPDALEGCRILWWLCTGADGDQGRAERATRVAQIDGCQAHLVRALHDNRLKDMAARALLSIMEASDCKHNPAWRLFMIGKLPQWFRMQVLIRQPDCIGGREMHHRVTLHARLKGSLAEVVPAGNANSVGDLKAKILAQPHQFAARGVPQSNRLNDWKLSLNGTEMDDNKSLTYYNLTLDSHVTLARMGARKGQVDTTALGDGRTMEGFQAIKRQVNSRTRTIQRSQQAKRARASGANDIGDGARPNTRRRVARVFAATPVAG